MSCDTRLKWVKDALSLLQEESSLFASPEDALYFRNVAKQNAPILENPPIQPDIPPLPPIAAPILSSPSIENEKPPEKPRLQAPPSPAVLPPKESSPVPWRTNTPISADPLNFASLRSMFQKVFPQFPLIQEIPSDATAKKIATRWKTKNQIAPISILYFNELPLQKQLLTEIAKAIDIYFGPARLIDAEKIEKEKQWEIFLSSGELKWIISCDYTLWQLTDLMRFYKEMPSQQTRTLGPVSLFLLPDLSLYLKDPLLKRSLWKSLCIKLSS